MLLGFAFWNSLRAWEAARLLQETELPRAPLIYALVSSPVWAIAFLGCALVLCRNQWWAARVTIVAILVHQALALAEQLFWAHAPEAQTRLGFAALVSASLVFVALWLVKPLLRSTASPITLAKRQSDHDPRHA